MAEGSWRDPRPWCQVGSTRRCQRCGPGSIPGGRSSRGSDGDERWLAPTRAGFDSPELHPLAWRNCQWRQRRQPRGSTRSRSSSVCRCPTSVGHLDPRAPGTAGVRLKSGTGRIPRDPRARPEGHRVRLQSDTSRIQHALGRARVARPGCLPGEAGSTPAESARLAVAQWTGAPPCEGGGRRFESSRRGSSCSRARFRRAESRRSDPRLRRGRSLKASASPPQLRRSVNERDLPTTGRLGRRRSDKAVERGSIPRSSMGDGRGGVRLKSDTEWRRSPRSSAEEQRASTPRVAGSSPAGELSQSRLVVGESGHPTDFGRRRSQVRVLPTRFRRGKERARGGTMGSPMLRSQVRVLSTRLSPSRGRRAVEERLSSRAS